MALCALVTRNTRVLLLPALLAIPSLIFQVLEFIVKYGSFEALMLVEGILPTFSLIAPLIFPIYVSWRMGILENLVAQAGLRKVNDYLEHAPKGWMIGQKSSLDISFLARGAGALTIFLAFSTFFVESNRKIRAIPWDNTYEHFGTCADGVRSGLERHIDCGPPESSCAQTCREKYGHYILIPADRTCSQVTGYVDITTQRACTAGYNTWARLNNRSNGFRHTKVYEGILYEDEFAVDLGNWRHADWTEGFRCGAYARQTISFVLQPIRSVSFPALFSPVTTKRQYQKPRAYLCFAGTSQSCNAKTRDTDTNHFEETMACPGPAKHTWFDSAWRNISGPFPTLQTPWRNSRPVAEFRAGKGRDGDCAEIQLLDVANIGAHVVFTLACDGKASARTQVTNRTENGIACPVGNKVKLSVKSGLNVRATLIISPLANMTNITIHHLDLTQRTITVYPDSTLTLVADYSSDLKTVTLCF